VIAALLLVVALLQGGEPRDVRRVDGRVTRGTRTAQQPIANQVVVLHRVGRDHSGPLDSTRTSAAGRFSFRYRTSGDSSAIYFATTTYGGIVYPTSPFRGPVVNSDDASITVFDTTSGPITIRIGGRHVIVGAPKANGNRPIGEVYDLENDTTVTAISRDTVTPVWSARIPPSAMDFQVNTNGELASGALSRRGATVGVYAPVSPGIRQVAFTYELPSSAFPLELAAPEPVGVLEVLVQEPNAQVRAASLRQVPSASADGRVFRRFLAQDLAANSVLRIDVPRMSVSARESVYRIVIYVLLAVMVVALVFGIQRGRRASRVSAAPAPVAEPRSRVLVRSIATLDDEYDRSGASDDAARDAYQSARESLKRELADALAAERGGA
jgi:hypothetical protein